jgi:hypothetical protein
MRKGEAVALVLGNDVLGNDVIMRKGAGIGPVPTRLIYDDMRPNWVR